MANKPYVSVIVPMYNVEKYIVTCIDSILGQTFQDFEIIVVDDASPDNCYEIVSKRYGNNDKVRIFRHRKNRGLGPARNTGIENARGKYVYFVDSDDAISSRTLEKLCEAAKQSDADVIHMSGWYETPQDDDKPFDAKQFKLKWEDHNQQGFLNTDLSFRLGEQWVKYHTWSMAWLCMCKKDFLYKHDIEFQPIISEDELFSFELYCHAEKYYKIHEALYIYRKRDGSIMKSYNMQRANNGINAIVLGLRRLNEIMNRGDNPVLVKNPALQTMVVSEFYRRLFTNHIYPFYSGANISVEFDSVVNKALKPTFEQDTDFVKYLLHNYSGIRRAYTNLLQQTRVLQQQLQQYQAKDSLMRQQISMLKLADKVKNVVDRAQNIPNRIFLLGTPQHGNLGDQAIVMGERYIIGKYFPNYEIIEIPYDYSSGVLWELLTGLGFKRYVRKSDIILMHGGGNLGNIWLNEEQVRRFIIQNFPDNKIVIFPQSVYFSNDAEGQRQLQESAKVYNSHSDLHLMLRDENSFNAAKNIFPHIHTYLLPDTVTALTGILDDVDVSREGVLFVLRKDKEKILDDAVIHNLQKYLAEKNIPYSVIDTVIADRVTEETRNDKVIEVIKKFRRSKLVITDRFHGVVFSVIAKTPVIAFKSFDTKISSGIKWFKDNPTVLYTADKTSEDIRRFIDTACRGEFADTIPMRDYAKLFVDVFCEITTAPPPPGR